MSENKHTPGPWRVLGPDEDTDQINVGTTDYFVAGAIGGFTDGGATQMANARLIAAAPDLLEALQTLETCDLSDLPGDVVSVVRAAIAKALPLHEGSGS